MGHPRLTGGRAGGRPLPVAVPDSARPTASRVREALFSMVGHELEGMRILDAFGGSGLLGLEAWSRGATVTIVEKNRRAARAIQANASGLGASIDVLCGDIFSILKGLEPFDGILADPPYALLRQPVVAGLAPWAAGWLVLEGDTNGDAPVGVGALSMVRERSYGGTRLWVFQREDG